MAKIPDKPDQIFEEFTSDYKQIFGDDLKSIILYGSAARGEYIPKKSDINFLVILSDVGIERFPEALDTVKKWEKLKVAIPLLLTEKYIENSLDSFPIEFLNLSSHYRVIFGKDVFDGIKLDRNDLRLQVERELKGKLLNLRQAYFQAAKDPKSADLLIKESFGTFLSLFPAILHLKEESISSSSLENIRRTALIFKLDPQVFERLYRIKQGNEKLKKSESLDFLRKYIKQIRSLALQADAL